MPPFARKSMAIPWSAGLKKVQTEPLPSSLPRDSAASVAVDLPQRRRPRSQPNEWAGLEPQ